jgi:hypothetical protein
LSILLYLFNKKFLLNNHFYKIYKSGSNFSDNICNNIFLSFLPFLTITDDGLDGSIKATEDGLDALDDSTEDGLDALDDSTEDALDGSAEDDEDGLDNIGSDISTFCFDFSL